MRYNDQQPAISLRFRNEGGREAMAIRVDEAGRLGSHRGAIHVIRFSPGGQYIASGDDQGILVIRKTWKGDDFHDAIPWPRLRVYRTGGAIRGLAWHPTLPRAIVVGSANGDINKLRFDEKSEANDYTETEHTAGFIHSMAFNKDGSQLAVAFGEVAKVALFDTSRGFGKKTAWSGGLTYLPLPDLFLDDHRDKSSLQVQVIRNLDFLSQDLLVLTFMSEQLGIRAYSTKAPLEEKWALPTDGHGSIGNSAISPSGNLVAVANLTHGITWYSIKEEAYWSQTTYSLGRQYALVVDIQFLDEHTVVAGHTDSQLVIAKLGRDSDPHLVQVADAGHIQAVATCSLDGEVIIACSTSKPDRNKELQIILFAVDRQVTDTLKSLDYEPEVMIERKITPTYMFCLKTVANPSLFKLSLGVAFIALVVGLALYRWGLQRPPLTTMGLNIFQNGDFSTAVAIPAEVMKESTEARTVIPVTLTVVTTVTNLATIISSTVTETITVTTTVIEMS